MQDPIQPDNKATAPPPKPSEDIVMVDVDDLFSSDDDFDSDFDALSEADILPEKSEFDPPSYSTMPTSMPTPMPHPRAESSPTARHVLQKSGKPDQPPPPPSYNRHGMCVICRIRPVFSDGDRTYATCGNTCAQKFKTISNVPNSTVMQGQMGNPYNTRSSSNHHPYSTGPAWPALPSSSSSGWHRQPPPRSQIKMCEVCHVRPQCQRGGKTYPTCGLTCAAKLQPPGTVEMCDFCKKRPKAVINGKKYPQCGRTCRDNSKQALTAAANSATCTTCLICWKAPKSGEKGDICSTTCKAAAEGRAPVLIEVPRGHVSFKKVVDAFADSWKKSKTTASCPRIKKIYMIYMKDSSLAKFKAYRDRINSPTLFHRKTNGPLTWLGIPRECGFGDPGNMEPCSSAQCLLCNIIKPSNRTTFSDGIPTTHILPRAVEAVSAGRKRASKVVMLASVVLGNVAERTELNPPLPPPGYNSVHLYAYSQFGMRVDWGETLVFDVAAIKPQYLISFE